MVLAHGVDNDISSDFMIQIQKPIQERKIVSFCFNFVYKEKGKKLPGSMLSVESFLN